MPLPDCRTEIAFLLFALEFPSASLYQQTAHLQGAKYGQVVCCPELNVAQDLKPPGSGTLYQLTWSLTFRESWFGPFPFYRDPLSGSM